MTLLGLALSVSAAAMGLFWSPAHDLQLPPELYGSGLYRRDTPFIAGGSRGSDLFSLFAVAPVAAWAALSSLSRRWQFVLLSAAHAWWLYLGISLAFGAVAFNEMLPAYIAMLPVSILGVALALNGMERADAPDFLAPFLVVCGAMTAAAWVFLLWVEISADQFPPTTYYTVRTTYALDLGLIAPGCVAAGIAAGSRWAWWPILAIPLLGVCAALLPMMALQTAMQLQAGVTFGPEAAAPLVGFGVISPVAAWFLWMIARQDAP